MSAAPDVAVQRAALHRLDALERTKSALLAQELRAAAQLGAVWGDDDGVLLEVAGTARVGQARAGTMLSRGERMTALFPVALGLLEAGVMRVGTVDILLAVSVHASRAVQAELDARCSEQVCLLDAADARKLLARAVLEIEADLDAAEQRERHERALADRFVSISATQDGMARITADLGVLDARRFGLDLEELVRAQKVMDDKAGVVRTQRQRRADVLARLPSLALAIAHAAQQGRLGDLLPESLLAAVPIPAPRASGDDGLGGQQVLPDLALLAAAGATGAGGIDQPWVDPGTLGMDELTLPGLPARTAPPCWRRDIDSLVGELLSLPVRGPSVMYVHTAMTTLLDLDQRAGWLEGIGAVSAMHARILLPSADLRRVAVDARTGVPLGIDIPPNTPWFETCSWTFEADPADPADPGQHPPDPPAGDDPHHDGGGDGGGGSGGPPRVSPPGAGAPASSIQPDPVGGRTEPRPASQQPSPVGQQPSLQARRQRARLLSLLRPMYLDHHAEPQHDPSSGLRQFARVRDMACDGPGCPRTADHSELDHEHDYALGGPTAAWNLKHRSTRCHHRKHGGWTVVHDHRTGISSWTSPAGSVYQRAPFWPIPGPLPEGTALSIPRLEPPLTVSDEQQPDVEVPLWHAPLPPGSRYGRVVDADDLREPRRKPPRPGSLAAGIAAANAQIAAAFPASTGWYDGPPPF